MSLRSHQGFNLTMIAHRQHKHERDVDTRSFQYYHKAYKIALLLRAENRSVRTAQTLGKPLFSQHTMCQYYHWISTTCLGMQTLRLWCGSGCGIKDYLAVLPPDHPGLQCLQCGAVHNSNRSGRVLWTCKRGAKLPTTILQSFDVPLPNERFWQHPSTRLLDFDQTLTRYKAKRHEIFSDARKDEAGTKYMAKRV